MTDANPDFAIRSWGDVLAVLTVAGVVVSWIVWNLKLESKIDLLRERIHNLELRGATKKRLLEDEE